jgi:hypothetical protein
VARIQWADVVERLAREGGSSVRVDDSTLRAAATLGDLADGLRPASAGVAP